MAIIDDNGKETEFEELHKGAFAGEDPDEEGKSDDDDEEIIFDDDDKGADDEAAAEEEAEDEDEEDEEDEEVLLDENEEDVEEDDLAGEPQKIKNRIMRERRLKDDAYKEAEEYKGQTLRLQAEIARGTSQFREAQRVAALALSEKTDLQIANANKRLISAREEGEMAVELEVQSELAQLKENKATIARAQSNIPTPEQTEYEIQQIMQQAHQANQQRNSTMANKWKSQNTWFDEPKHAPEKGAVLAIADVLDAEPKWRGRSNDPEYFDELNRRLRKSFPSMKRIKSVSGKVTPVVETKKTRTGTKGKVATARGTTRTGVKAKAKDGLPPFTKQMAVRMRAWNLDPNDKRARDEFRRNIAE